VCKKGVSASKLKISVDLFVSLDDKAVESQSKYLRSYIVVEAMFRRLAAPVAVGLVAAPLKFAACDGSWPFDTKVFICVHSYGNVASSSSTNV
jgi:hypothetical protein